jgi:ABC-type bacteriocin/lantibiotic exporter with double-glycine peptidase domain
MILAYHGEQYSEEELVKEFYIVPGMGTAPESVVTGLENFGYHALWFANASLERLIDLLAYDWPVIVFVRAMDLPHGRSGYHSLVVVGIEDEQVICLDPSLSQESRFELAEFVQLWNRLKSQGIVLWP